MSDAIGHYEILGVLGTGALGTVFRARDTQAGRTVAVRVLSEGPRDPLDRTRLIELIRPFTAASHPNVATLFDVGEYDGQVYLVHEFVPGEKLSAQIAGRPLNLRRALDLAIQIADALAEIHAVDVFHGMLSTGSIFVTPKGRAKLLDLGLVVYRPDGGRPADARRDIFALGTVLYEALTGRPAFSDAEVAETGMTAVQAAASAPSLSNAAVTRTIDRCVARALASDPVERYQSAAEMAAELRTAAEEIHARDAAVEVRPAATPLVTGRPRTAFLAALLVTAVSLAAWQWHDALLRLWPGGSGQKPAPFVIVMPFSAGGGDGTRPHYGPGLAEDIAGRLGEVTGLTVFGRGSIRALAGRAPRTVAAAFRASVALTGVVTPADPEWKKLGLKLTLIAAADGRTIWSRDYSTSTADILALDTRVARDVAERLGVTPKPGAGARRTALRIVDAGAFDLYLQGREALAAQDASRAVLLFDNAATADPTLIEAQTGLAEALYAGAAFEGRMALADVTPRVRTSAEQAATTDPDAAAVSFAEGLAAPTLREALVRLRSAIEQDASYVAAYAAVADLLRGIDPARSMAFSQRVIELDPMLPLSRYQLASAHIALGEFDQTLVETARGQALAPSWPWWDALRTRIHLAKSPAQGVQAAVAGRSGVDVPPAAVVRAAALLAGGRSRDAGLMLEDMTRLYPSACDAWAMLAGMRIAAGDRAEAMRLAAAMLGQADRADNPAVWTRCAATMAATAGDSERAAYWIARAAASDEGLRQWGAANGVLDPTSAIRQKLYPWKNVTGTAPVSAAVAALESAIVRARADAARILDGLLELRPPR